MLGYKDAAGCNVGGATTGFSDKFPIKDKSENALLGAVAGLVAIPTEPETSASNAAKRSFSIELLWEGWSCEADIVPWALPPSALRLLLGKVDRGTDVSCDNTAPS